MDVFLKRGCFLRQALCQGNNNRKVAITLLLSSHCQMAEITGLLCSGCWDSAVMCRAAQSPTKTIRPSLNWESERVARQVQLTSFKSPSFKHGLFYFWEKWQNNCHDFFTYLFHAPHLSGAESLTPQREVDPKCDGGLMSVCSAHKHRKTPVNATASVFIPIMLKCGNAWRGSAAQRQRGRVSFWQKYFFNCAISCSFHKYSSHSL